MLVRQRRCCAMMSGTVRLLVNRNVGMGGGTDAAISAMSSSEITPGPLGILETSPSAEAPAEMATCASAALWMQQTLTGGHFVNRAVKGPAPATVSFMGGVVAKDLQ